MVEKYRLQSNSIKELETPKKEAIDWIDLPTIVVSHGLAKAALGNGVKIDEPACIRLDLEDLKCFEAVDSQFERWGVTFTNTMAIHPSNPAFPPYYGNTVLIGAPKSGSLEATFSTPVSYVSAFVTSSRRAVLAAYDQEGVAIAHAEISGANLAGSEGLIAPNTPLCVRVPNIHRVTFFTFDGHLTVDGFSYHLQNG
ncbi:hypothetical protein H6F56_02565 [Microcoleus sp. FACHB-672]|nr:hypothetical protein [Microcoleus sp. FACHB-672]